MKKYHLSRFMKAKGQRKLICLTAYDAFSAQLMEHLPVDLILVGDTLGHVVQGKESTIPVTMQDVIYHCKIVTRQAPNRFVVADMPFGSFGVSVEDTVRNCMKVFKASGVEAIKMEGASDIITEAIPQLSEIGVPVMGHLGLRPQSVSVYGGYKVDGKTEEEGERLLKEAKKLEAAGVFSLVLECVTEPIAQYVTKHLNIPTIGIGSGRHVDGQILVLHDLLGMSRGKVPSFVRQYTNLNEISQSAIQQWINDIHEGSYPSDEELYQMPS